MTASNYMPDVTVEIAFDSSFSTVTSLRNYTDVSAYVELDSGINITHGRGDEFSVAEPNKLNLTLDNTDGRFTTGKTGSPYYPNIKIGRPIRVRSRWPVGTAGNMHPNPSVETSAAGWYTTVNTTVPAASVAQSAVRAFDGTKSVLATWMTSALGCNAGANVSGHVLGRTYIASMYVYVPTGSPDVRLKTGITTDTPSSSYTSLKDQWVRLSVTYAPSASLTYISVESAASTAGQTCYIDAAMVDEGTTLQTYTATPPPISDRFVGYVDEWPVEWPGTDSSALARITASSRMARLGFDAELRSAVEEEYLLEAFPRGSVQPVYFPLGEPTDSTIAVDVTKNGTGRLAKVQLGAGGELNFGANTGPGTDSVPAPAFLPVDVTNGVYLTGAVGASCPLTLEAFLLTSAAVQQTVVRLREPGKSWIELSTTSTGEIRVSDFDVLSGAASLSLTSPLSYNDGATHHAAASLSESAGTITVKLFVDGVSVADTTYTATLASPYTEMNVGGNPEGALFTGTISHVAVFAQVNDVTRILPHATAGLTGFAGETATQRIVRLAGYALIPAAEVSGDAGTHAIEHIDTTGRTALDSMRVVEATESGVLYDARDNTLTFKGRAARYNVTSAFTLSATAQQVEAGITPSLDRSALTNDVTGTAADGTTARAVNQTSIDEYGYARSSVDVAGSTDDALQAASWRVNTYGEPLPRIPSLGVDFLPLSAGLQASLLGAGVGTRFTLAGLPTQAQATSVDFFIEGYTETIGPESYAFTFNLSPVTGFDVWTIEDPVFGQWDAYPLAL